MEQSYNLRSPAVKRLMREAKELKDKTEQFSAHPLEDNLFEWHFTIRGPVDTEFENGLYHGRIVLPPDYPMKPPSIILLTPSGRFEVNRKICLSISGYHPETWQPSWSLRTALLGIIGFMPSHGNGAIGSLDYTPDERRILAKKSQDWKCPQCGPICNLVLPVTELSKKLNAEAKELGLQIKMQGEKTKTTESSETPPATATPTPTSATGPSPAQNLQMPHQRQFFTAAAAQLNQHSTFPNIPLAPSFAFPYFGGAPPANSTPSQFPLLPHMPSQFSTSFLPPPPLLPPFFCPPFPPPPPLMTHQTPGTSTQQNVYGMPSYPFNMNPTFSSSDYYRQWPFPNTAASTATITAATAAAAAEDASSGITTTATISAATSVISSTARDYTSSTITSVAVSAARMSTTASAGGVVVSSAANLGNSSSVVTTIAAAKMTTAKMTSTEATATTASAPEPVTKATNVSLTNSSSKAVTTTAAADAATSTTTLQSSSKLNEENKSTSSSTAFTSTSSPSTAAATTSSPPPSTTSASETSSSSNLRQRKQSQSTSAASTSPTNGSTPAAAARPIRTQQRRSARLLSGPIRMFAAGLLDFFIIIIAFAIFSLIGFRMLWMV